MGFIYFDGMPGIYLSSRQVNLFNSSVPQFFHGPRAACQNKFFFGTETMLHLLTALGKTDVWE